MQEQWNDEEVERYLKGFLPCEVAPLRIPGQAASIWMGALAIAAGVILAGCIALWYGTGLARRTPSSRASGSVHTGERQSHPRISTFALSKLALENDRAFEDHLNDESRTMFPRMQEERSALRVLAKP